MSENPHADVIREVGIFGLKTLLTLNSGAAIVLLTFVGNVYGEPETAILIDLLLLKWAMVAFLGGISCAMLSVTATYLLSQFSGAQHPAIERMSSAAFLAWMVGPAVASFLFFVAGFLCATFALGG